MEYRTIEDKLSISLSNTTYELKIKQGDDFLSIEAKSLLTTNEYKRIFSLDALTKMPLFKNYDTIREMADELKDIIKDKNVSISVDYKIMNILIKYQLRKSIKTLNLTLNQIENGDKIANIEELSSMVKSHDNKLKQLESSIDTKIAKKENQVKQEIFLIKEECNKFKLEIEKNNEEVLLLKEELASGKDQFKKIIKIKDDAVIILKNDLTREINELKKELNKRHDYLSVKKVDKEESLQMLYKIPKCLIKNINEEKLLKDWIDPYSIINFTLIYDSLTDSDSAIIFHSKCDNKGPNLSIIESEHGLRFGGYSKHSWNSNNTYETNDQTAFIFSLTKAKKFFPKNINSKVVGNLSKFNVIYGDDICVYDNFTDTSDNYSDLGHSYDAFWVNDSKTYLAGSQYFKVKRVEVYKVDKL